MHDSPDLATLLHRPGPGSHLATLLVDGREVITLADLPPLRNRLLFVGTRPSAASVAAGHYHQGAQGQRLWERLEAAEILPAGTSPLAADDALVAAGHGITDLLKVPEAPGASPDEPTDEALTAGVGPLWRKISIWRPAAVVFLDRRAAESVARRSVAEPWGELRGVALSGRPCLLLPGPSATPAVLAEAIAFFRNLSAILPDALPPDPVRLADA